MKADDCNSNRHKEVTMTKRLMLFVLIVAAFLVLAAPALAFDGWRADYTTADMCGACHAGSAEFDGWAASAHAMVGEATVTEDPENPGEWILAGTANAEPIADGPGCAGCHSSNYNPAAHVPDAVTGVYPWQNTAGDDAFSEPFVGCSSCHRGLNSAHVVPTGNMANPDVCGQCHSRYSASVERYANYDGSTSVRQYTLGDFNPLGEAATDPVWSPLPITDFLNIPEAGKAWPDGVNVPSQSFYSYDGELLPYNARIHEEGAVQYNEWSHERHADALETLRPLAAFMDVTECLECHSADYRLLEEAGDLTGAETIDDFKYGITCVTCHDPHAPGAQTSVWNEERNPQLAKPRKDLCVECHNGHLGDAPAEPGTAVHHPMNEMMNGTGGIDVPQGSPSVHKNRCVQCHMAPVGRDRFGTPGTAGNHDFGIIEPEVAAEATVTLTPPGGTATEFNMPTSSCSTCHKQDGTDQALYLQETLDDRQAAMHNWDSQVTAALAVAAGRLGFTGADDAEKIANANEILNAKKDAGGKWNASQLNFQKAFTNQQFVESEGSWGIHNWEYARSIILKAKEQANAVATVRVVTIRSSARAVRLNARVTISGQVNTATAGKVTIQRKRGSGSWANWKTVNVTSWGKYSSGAVRMTARGTFRFRARFVANDSQVGGTSTQVRVVVR